MLPRFVTTACLCAGLLGLSTMGFAQTPVGGDGRLLDANPALGGYRYNVSRPVSPLLNGNFLAQGNARFGQSLRISSPVGDPTSFTAGLPSAGLSNFTRDSFSVGDYYSGVGQTPGPSLYYDPQRTAPTAGFLLGRQGAGASTYTNTYQTPGAVRTSSDYAYSQNRGAYSSLPGLLDYSAPTDTRRQPQYESPDFTNALHAYKPELSSSIFGVNTEKIPGPLTPDQLGPKNWQAQPPETDSTANATQLWRPIQFQTPEQKAANAANAPDANTSPLDRLMNGDIRTLLSQGWTTPTLTEQALTPTARNFTSSTPIGKPKAKSAPQITDSTVLPGQDVFTDMQLALSLQSDPGADWFAAMQDSIRGNPLLERETQAVAEEQATDFINKVLSVPIRTFVGGGKNAFNNEMLKAESFMEIGQYYDAAKRYDQARLLAPQNPLPYVGKAHALLAAGEYMSAAANLVQGLERFPELAKVKFDLTTLMGGVATVDVRRSDLARRLESSEDYRLRFLLGYLELYSGNHDFALENLDRAASEAPIGSLIRRYPDMVRGVGMLPPREAPQSEPTEEEATSKVEGE